MNTPEAEKERIRKKIREAIIERKRFLKIGARLSIVRPSFENAIIDVANEEHSGVLDIHFLSPREGRYEQALLKLAVAKEGE